MKTVISCKINNLIRGYCSNFLSYLYKQNGWKRAVFETCKENFIPSDICCEDIRILVKFTCTFETCLRKLTYKMLPVYLRLLSATKCIFHS